MFYVLGFVILFVAVVVSDSLKYGVKATPTKCGLFDENTFDRANVTASSLVTGTDLQAFQSLAWRSDGSVTNETQIF